MDDVGKLIKKKWKILEHDRSNEIYALLFTDWNTTTGVSKILYPDLHRKKSSKKRYKVKYKLRPHSVVSKYIRSFLALKYLEVKNDSYDSRKTLYRTKIDPYFDWLEDKGIKLKAYEKNFVEKQVSKARSSFYFGDGDFFERIDKIIKRSLYGGVELYFKDIFDSLERRYSDQKICIDLALKLYDKVTLRILHDYLELRYMSDGKKIKDKKKLNILLDLIDKIEVKLREDSDKILDKIDNFEIIELKEKTKEDKKKDKEFHRKVKLLSKGKRVKSE